MANFDLDQYNLHQNYALEASAGSGKTFSVIAIVVKLLKKGIPLDKILIVTYTEKAAGELKNRLREKIKEVGLTGVNIDQNAIYTIHSFCKHTIDEYNILLNVSSKLNLASDNDLEDFLSAYVRDNEEIKNELKYYDAKVINGFIKKTYSGINAYYLNKNKHEDKSIVTLDKEIASLLLIHNKEELYQTYPLLAGYLKELAESNDDKYVNFSKVVTDSIEYNNGQIMFDGRTYRATGFKGNYKNMFIYINDIKEYQNSLRPDIILATRYLATTYEAWEAEKKQKNIQTFNDMLKTVREAICDENCQLIDVLKEKYQYGIIDEFQDTNQLQWDIFSHLFLSDNNHHIIVVGDPKQSIYSFQGADVSVYQEAVNQIVSLGGVKENLPYNWRATTEMIDAGNLLFSDEFFRNAGISFIPPLAPKDNKKEATFDGKPLKPIWFSDDIETKDFGELAVQRIIDCTTIVNGKTRLQIKEKDDYRNVTYSDIVVLSRTRSEVVYIEKALKRYDIPFIKHKDNSLFQSSECKQWIILLKCLITPDLTGKNSQYFKEALFTKFFNKTLYEINDANITSITSPEFQKIIHWQDLIKRGAFEDLIDDIIIESGMMENKTQSMQMDNKAKFRQLGDIAVNYLMNNHTVDDLVHYLMKKNSQVDNDDEEATDDDIVERNTNLDAVRVMTIHASKGLEFPVVVDVAGFRLINNQYDTFYKRDNDNNKVLYFKTDDNNNNDFIIEEWMRLFYVALTRAKYLLILPVYADVKDSHNGFLKMQYRKLINNEAAKDYFVIANTIGSVAKYKDEVNKTIRYFAGEKEKKNSETDEQITERLQKTIDVIKESKTSKHSYSSLTHAHEEVIIGDTLNLDKEGSSEAISLSFDNSPKWLTDLEYDEKIAPIAISPNYPKGAIIGTALHEIMEKLDFTSKDNDAITQLIKQVMSYYGYENEVWLTDTKELVKNVLEAKLPIINGSSFNQEYFSLNSIDGENKLAEVEFNFNKENEFLKDYFTGFIDLIIRQGEYYSVLDWKSDTLNDEEFDSYAKPASLKNHVDERYAIQRVLYSYVLIKWLKRHYPGKTEEDIFNNHFGGVYYVFLKGCNKGLSNGIYAQTWENYHELEAEYQKIIQLIGGKK